MVKNHGFVAPTFKPTDHLHVLGAKDEILSPDRNWIDFIPKGEIQKRKVETSSCTVFGTNNGIETLEKRKFGSTNDYAERPVAIGSGQNEIGNDPSKVADWIRHNGLVKEELLPFDDSITSFEQYISSKNLTCKIKREGKKWLKTRDFGYKWVFTTEPLIEKQRRLYDSLQYSVSGVAVDAWRRRENGLYYKLAPANHWSLLISAVWGEKWLVYDSYLDDGHFIKELEWDYDFDYAQRYSLNEKISEPSFFSKWFAVNRY